MNKLKTLFFLCFLLALQSCQKTTDITVPDEIENNNFSKENSVNTENIPEVENDALINTEDIPEDQLAELLEETGMTKEELKKSLNREK